MKAKAETKWIEDEPDKGADVIWIGELVMNYDTASGGLRINPYFLYNVNWIDKLDVLSHTITLLQREYDQIIGKLERNANGKD